MKPTVLVPEPIAELGMELLRSRCHPLAPWSEGRQAGSEELYALLSEADAVVVRLFEVREEHMRNAPRLKVIAKHGVGVDNIDVPAATTRGIPVVFTPNANANGVAEHAMALMLSLARNITPASQALHAGRFQDRNKYIGMELAGKTLGVLGLGRIGSRVAEMAHHGFGMEVRAYDPFVSKDYAGSAILESSLETLLSRADFLTLHMPLTDDTRRMINEERLRMLKPGCRIINTSRGDLIDEGALAWALHAGQLAGAALDVFEQEPLPAAHPFLKTPNTLLTPHISSSTNESMQRMAVDAVQGVLDVLDGQAPRYAINPGVAV